MKIIRAILGAIILFFDAFFTPKSIVNRSAEEQARLDEKTKSWTLYELQTCPFCVKVRRHLKRLMIEIPKKDVNKDPRAHEELMTSGKIDQVPCLHYQDAAGNSKWMYESSDINDFLSSIAFNK